MRRSGGHYGNSKEKERRHALGHCNRGAERCALRRAENNVPCLRYEAGWKLDALPLDERSGYGSQRRPGGARGNSLFLRAACQTGDQYFHVALDGFNGAFAGASSAALQDGDDALPGALSAGGAPIVDLFADRSRDRYNTAEEEG